MELRASWSAYLDEFGMAYESACEEIFTLPRVAFERAPVVGNVEKMRGEMGVGGMDGSSEALTNFEAKYVRVGTPVYQLVIGE